jgi:hypothetical protein
MNRIGSGLKYIETFRRRVVLRGSLPGLARWLTPANSPQLSIGQATVTAAADRALLTELRMA